MSIVQFVIHDREDTPVGAIVRFSVYEGPPDDLCWCGKLCMSGVKFDELCAQLGNEGSTLDIVEDAA